LASDALANRILFPVVGARSLTSSDGVCPASLGKQKTTTHMVSCRFELDRYYFELQPDAKMR